MKRVLIVLLLSGCSTTGAVLSMGPDTYQVTAAAAPVLGGPSKAQEMALQQANNHCAAMGKQIMVTNTSQRTTNGAGAGSADVTFQCLAAGDRDLRRPSYSTPPTAVIEDRRK